MLPRSGHAVARTTQGLVLCGGYDGNTRFGDLLLAHDDSLLGYGDADWVTPTVRGDAFPGRAGHLFARCADDTYLMALGYTSEHDLLGDSYRVRIASHAADDEAAVVVVERLAAATKPRRWPMGGVLADGSLIAYGGWDESGPLGHVEVLDTRMQWHTVAMAGAAPKARRWAACDIITNRLVVQGGYDGKLLGDAWACDLVAGRWMRLPWSDLPRCRHTLCGGSLVGGFDAKDAIYRSHVLLDAAHPLDNDVAVAPAPVYGLQRAGHASCALDANRVAIVAGFEGAKRKLVQDTFVWVQ